VAAGLDSRGAAPTAAHSELQAHAAAAARAMGAEPPHHLGLPDNALDSIPLLDVIKAVEAFVEKVRPSVVYTHHRGDLNVDHGVVHDAVLTACRPIGDCPVQRILSGETLSSSEWQSPDAAPFRPTIFHDITDTIDAKAAAMEAYAGEIRAFPHPRSVEAIRALAAYRGSTAGYVAGEAFMLVRERA
jgi:LmbE family N-acetylglucosaminyl deacetylase